MANKITYTNKERLIDNPSIAEENKVTDTDMNEIKQVVNSNADELEDKVDKIEGKGLSTNDFTDEYKEQIEALQTENVQLKQELKDTRNASYKIYTETPSTNVTLNNTSKNKFIKFGVGGNRKQTTYEGYNLLPITDIDTFTEKGMNFKIENQVIFIQGTSTSGINVEMSATDLVLKANQAYTIATISEGTTSATGTNISTLLGNSNKTNIVTIRDAIGTHTVNYTPTEDIELTQIRTYVGQGNITCNMKTKLMVLKGTYTSSNLPEYEPYTHGQAPNSDYECPIYSVGENGTANVVVCNKNLVSGNATNTSRGMTTTLNKNILTISGTTAGNWWSGVEIPCKIKKGALTVSIRKTLPFTLNFILTLKDGTTKNLSISSGNLVATNTILEDAVKYNINFASATADTTYNETINLQLEQGSTTTTYTEHQEQDFTIPCQKEMVDQSDYFDWDNEQEIHGWKKKIFDGTEEWLGSDNVYYITSIIDREYSTTKQLGISNKFAWKGNFNSLNTAKSQLSNGEFGMFSTSASSIYFKNTDIQTVADWKAYLAEQYANGTPVYIWYKLAEPELLPFTSEQKAVAKALNKATSYYEQTNIFSNDNVSPIYDITAVGDANLVIDEISNAVVALGGV